MNHLLIIGVGYVGSTLKEQAVDAGWRVTGVTKSGEGNELACDVSSLESVAALKSQIDHPEAIVFCASSGRGGAEAYRAVFLDGIRNIIELFPTSALVFVSSSSVYAQADGEEVDEQSETRPTRETGEILLASEKSVLAHGGIVARLAGIYGPERSVLLKKLLNGDAVIEEDGRRIINQIHQHDAASALFFLVKHYEQAKGEIFNVADSFPKSQLDTYKGLCERFDLPLPPTGERNLNKKRGWTHKAVSNQKLRQLGWEPEFADFLEAAEEIRETIV